MSIHPTKSIVAVAACSLTLLVGGCESIGDSFDSINPFAEKELILPGERREIAANIDPAGNPLMERKAVGVPQARSVADWSQPGGNAANNPGNVALSSGSGARAWRTKIPTESGGGFGVFGSSDNLRVSSRPIAYQGRVVVYDPSGSLSSFSLSSGGRAWSIKLRPKDEPDIAPGGGVAADQGMIFVATGYSSVSAVSPSNGQTIWTKELEAPARSAPTASGGKVYVVTQTNVIVALDQKDGNELWSYRGIPEAAGVLSAAAPAVSGDTVIVPYSSGEVIALNTKTGEVRWTEAISRSYRTLAVSGLSDVAASPVIDGGTVFATGLAGRIIAVGIRKGNRIWEQDVGSAHTPVVTPSAVYLVDLNDRVIALNRKSGAVMWATQLPIVRTKKKNTNWAGPVLASGALWLVSNEGSIAAVAAGTGEVISNRDLGAPGYLPPIAASGKLVIVTGKGDLTALN